MKIQVFSLPFDPESGFDDAALTEFCARNEILDVREYLLDYQGQPWLAIVASYRDGEVASRSRPGARAGREPDARRDLAKADVPLYEALREWRSLRAAHDGVPPYLIFNNRQLAEIATRRPATKAALGEIPGIGEGKLERFADNIFAVLESGTGPEAPSP